MTVAQPTAFAGAAEVAGSNGHDLSRLIVFEDVSKFYDEVLGVNRVNLAIGPGITGLVGPNGSGKSTLFNLATGLLTPSRGRIRVLGVTTDQPRELFQLVGYATQFDSFPKGMTARRFVESFLRLHGERGPRVAARAREALERVGLTEAADRKVAGFSKGMRQRVRLAQAIAHHPSVLLLDEPLNGLDPVGRSEMIALFQQLAADGLHVVVSSHILHEIDMISDQVVLLNGGYVVAEGNIRGVRGEMEKHPLEILVRCDRPAELAARAFAEDGVVEAKLVENGAGVAIRTKDAEGFYLALNRLVRELDLDVSTVMPADEDVQSVYEYLIGGNGGGGR
jgi:ABC-2 type transport system ATP-binding protein